MKQLIILVFALLLLQNEVSAQSGLYYWVKFKDKNNNGYSLNHPEAFLSQKSIERRTKQGIAIDSSDLPITQSYLDTLTPLTIRLVHRLKWINLAVVEVIDSNAIAQIHNLSFVDSIGHIVQFPPRKAQFQQSKFEAVTNDIDIHMSYSNKYGYGYPQLTMLNADWLHKMGYTGTGVIISMMDNGFPNVDQGAPWDSARPNILATYDFVHLRQNVYLDGEHGTTTFSCIAANLPGQFVGTAPNASFYLFQTEDNSHEWVMEEYNWEAAAEFADSAGAQIFSTSLGYTTFDNSEGSHSYADLTGDKAVMTHAGNLAFSKGILVLNSAGNSGADSWHYVAVPADGDSIMAIGAVDSLGHIANFSSRGPNAKGQVKPDVCAQGQKAVVVGSNGMPANSNGTSFSCPIMAGCAACLWQAFPNKTASQIKAAIIQSANKYNNPDSSYGYGIPDFYKAYKSLLDESHSADTVRLSNNFMIYPNPFVNTLTIQLDGYEVHTAEIFDMLGRKVYEQEFQLTERSFQTAIINNLDALDKGTYVLRLDQDKHHSYKLVKIKQ